MKQYIIAGVMALLLILLIIATTWVTLNDVSLGDIKILAIEGMQIKDKELDTENLMLETTKIQYNAVDKSLQNAKNQYINAKNAYNNISQADIDLVKEETREQHYTIEWIWIILGEYAIDNNLDMHIIDPRQGPNDREQNGTLQIQLEGTFTDVANFVFEVENDNDLRYKLDNMLMEYSKDNKIKATFDVLSMEVLF